MAVPHAMRGNLFYKKGASRNLWTRIHELRDHRPVDILVFGSSYVFNGIDPRFFAAQGFSVFILGSAGQTMLQTEVLLDRYMEQLDPKLILIEVSPVRFSRDGVRPSLGFVIDNGVDIPAVKMAFRTRNIKVLNTLIYVIERQLLQLDRDYNYWAAFPKKERHYVSGGYVEETSRYSVPMVHAKPFHSSPITSQKQAFVRILQHLAEKRRKVVLIEAPVTRWYYSAYVDHIAHERWMASVASYFNFNGMAGLVDSTDFKNEHHLNQSGAEIFDRALLDSLKVHDLLPQPRVPR